MPIGNCFLFIACHRLDLVHLAVVMLDVKAEGMRCGMSFKGEFRNVRIFLKEPGKQPEWQLHFWFNTSIDK